MRSEWIACWIALAAVLITCKKEADVDGNDRAEPASTGTGPSAVEEPASGTDAGTPEKHPTSPGAPAKRTEAAPTASADGTRSPTGAPPATGSPTVPAPTPEAISPPPSPIPRAAEAPVSARPPLPDLRLLLTAADIAEAGGGKTEFQRTVLPGVEPGPDRQSLYFEPVKGKNFGFAIQVFREGDSQAARQRWESAFATYPNAVEIAPVAGSSFFAYWGEVLHVGFLQPHGNLIVVVSCGRKYCDSDALYALAKKANSRIR